MIVCRLSAAALAVCAALPAHAYSPSDGRRTSDKDLEVPVQRLVLPNGLVVLLAPDPAATGVWVRMSYRAGTLYEPPGRSGLAHLVEHVFFNGPTPETDYAAILDRRRARHFNALTNAEELAFDVLVPPEELPLALWCVADRTASVPPAIDAAMVERHRKIALQ